ncbi:MAG: hypothetical protein QM779_15545 [Propionicimonas sp.]|uniref:hypothetical protein n=1 Tax=Propionicimonas sp. TaxID=1955623 RepID=UPI003D09B5F2
MTPALATERDACAEVLRQRLEDRTRHDPSFWDFEDSPRRGGGHAFFQYPAMMVPELQGALLDDLLAVQPNVKSVFDPFMGSGTVLLESIYRGLDFFGVDINPMAVLLSHVKAAPPSIESATRAVAATVDRAKKSDAPDFDFPNIQKWFTPSVRSELSRLRQAIMREPELEIRRFLWVCMAETIRLVSSSRTSTVKLHAYSAEQLAARKPEAMSTFASIGMANSHRAGDHWERVSTRSGSEVRSPEVTLQRASILSDIVGPSVVDAIMSSPPYGDNHTTVTYGQHSYLPLRWINERDLVGTLEPSLLASTGRIDHLSLGGSLLGALGSRADLEAKSPTLATFLPKIEGRPDLIKKVLSFSRDYDLALSRASAPLRIGGFSFWTLAERRVGGEQVPLILITEELLAQHGQEKVHLITRRLPLKRKRMAGTNSIGSTMSREYVLVTAKVR